MAHISSTESASYNRPSEGPPSPRASARVHENGGGFWGTFLEVPIIRTMVSLG